MSEAMIAILDIHLFVLNGTGYKPVFARSRQVSLLGFMY